MPRASVLAAHKAAAPGGAPAPEPGTAKDTMERLRRLRENRTQAQQFRQQERARAGGVLGTSPLLAQQRGVAGGAAGGGRSQEQDRDSGERDTADDLVKPAPSQALDGLARLRALTAAHRKKRDEHAQRQAAGEAAPSVPIAGNTDDNLVEDRLKKPGAAAFQSLSAAADAASGSGASSAKGAALAALGTAGSAKKAGGEEDDGRGATLSEIRAKRERPSFKKTDIRAHLDRLKATRGAIGNTTELASGSASSTGGAASSSGAAPADGGALPSASDSTLA